VKFETTPAFDSDYRRLKPEHRTAFRLAVKEKFGPACDAYAADPSTRWPSALRVKPVRNAPGVLEMTWSFAGPDGRATFELITVDDDLRCRWRRVGEHAASKRP
jgi:hypothetical protein